MTKADKKLTKYAMTVHDLIEALEKFHQDAYVVFQCDYGDYTHTQQALPVTDVAELEGVIRTSCYSNSCLAVYDRKRDMSKDDVVTKGVVVLT